MTTSPTLLVLAAGMGSRYGGLKQIDPVGPCGEIVIDYSIYDALRAGFGRVVFVIRKDIEESFREAIGRRLEARADVDYVYQELSALPPGYSIPPNRTKPWGTGHAILMARQTIREPFASINADDFYGAHSYKLLGQTLSATKTDSDDHCMVGFTLRHTLSDYGSVARGICECDPKGFLQRVEEHTRIEKAPEGARSFDANGRAIELTGQELVSMNMWGFTPALFPQLETEFKAFLDRRSGDPKAELYIPSVVDALVAQ
ncbi:MAG TPA: nucleotidyltransferase, partial [Verrucomicrobia bacterium]|nr:nucleotidyltransferase [Verrucomicrobiota bacterium]